MHDKAAQLYSAFSAGQLRLLRRLNSPRKVQDFLDYELQYNDDEPGTCFSPLKALERRRAHCLEGALLACAAFLLCGRPPLLLDLKANGRDDDHVIAPFRERGRWGAVALSRFCALRFREPAYASPAELARSYFEFYYNNRGEKTLRSFSAPFDARRLKAGWLDSRRSVLFAARHLDSLRHCALLPPGLEPRLRRADSSLVRAEVLGSGRRPLASVPPVPYARLRLPRRLT